MNLVCVIHREGGRHSQIPAVNCAYFCTLWEGGILNRNCLFVFIYGKPKSKIILPNSRHTDFRPKDMKILILYFYIFKVILYFLTPPSSANCN